jgi:hypothetical protein
MTRDGTPRPVAIFTRGSSGLYADEGGVTVDGPMRIRRFAWPDISHFADGMRGEDWVLDMVLHSGRRVPVPCTAGSRTPELLAVVRRLAEVYGIPARMTGIGQNDPDDVPRRAPAWEDRLDRWMESAATPGQFRRRVAVVVLLVVAGFVLLILSLILAGYLQGPLCSVC